MRPLAEPPEQRDGVQAERNAVLADTGDDLHRSPAGGGSDVRTAHNADGTVPGVDGERIAASNHCSPKPRLSTKSIASNPQLVSSKFYYGYDESVCIDDFLNAAGDDLFSADTLKRLELELLDALDWNVYVSNVDFFAKLCSVERQLAQQQGSSRGWLTYTELAQLFPSVSIAQAFVAYSAVFAVSYVASVFTIAGAFLVASQVPGSALYFAQMPQQNGAVETVGGTAPAAARPTAGLLNHERLTGDNDDVENAAVDAERRLNEDADMDLAQQSTEQDDQIERIVNRFDTDTNASSSSSPLPTTNAFNSDYPATYNQPNKTSNRSSHGAWPQRIRLSDHHHQPFEFGLDSVGLERLQRATSAFPSTQRDRVNCSRYDADDVAGFSDGKCHRSSGYETLLRWIKFM